MSTNPLQPTSLDEIDASILAELSCISHALELYANIYKELCTRVKWYQFWRKVKTDEAIYKLIEAYSQYGTEHPDYAKGSAQLQWIIADVYNEVQRSLAEIEDLKALRSTLDGDSHD